MERVDVAVVGGGPAGASAARAAAGGGADTVLLEKGVPRADRVRPGPDSTDAAGILDYWVDLMEVHPAEMPDGIVLRELDHAEFIGPTERVVIRETGIDSSYPHFGFTYDRTKFDDWMVARAEEAGAECRIGDAVQEVATPADGPHTVLLRDGTEIKAANLVLADGPGRSMTMGVLDRFLPPGRAEAALGTTRANHIAYQEYRRFPDELFEADVIKFWWGHMPGHTAYPWVFPNEETIARVGLTMPIGVDLDTVEDRGSYRLLRPDDERIPTGREYLERLLELAYPRYGAEDFPVIEGKGKRAGTETYPISSTRPVDSPTRAQIAVTGGAMGATSAFHEGGAHVAVRTGAIAGELAARGELARYNPAWKAAIGDEIRRNVAIADLVREYRPADWDRTFRIAARVLDAGTGTSALDTLRRAGVGGLRLLWGYKRRKFGYRDGRYVQIRESEYSYPGR